jgi:hypothetical protein
MTTPWNGKVPGPGMPDPGRSSMVELIYHKRYIIKEVNILYIYRI